MKRKYWLIHYSYKWQLLLFLLGLIMFFAQGPLHGWLSAHPSTTHAYIALYVLLLVQFGLMKRCDLATWRRAHGAEDATSGETDPGDPTAP